MADLRASPLPNLRNLPLRNPGHRFISPLLPPLLRRVPSIAVSVSVSVSDPNDNIRRSISPYAKAVPKITDEWGETTDPEPEPPSDPEPPSQDDEWGRDPDETPSCGKRAELKKCLADNLRGTEVGFRASSEEQAEILELITQLEAENPTPSSAEAPELLDGNWVLLYTTISEILVLLAIGAIPLLKVKKISQTIDSKDRSILNSITISSPVATFSFGASAFFEYSTPSRIQVEFKEGSLHPPDIISPIDLPENIDIFGQSISLSPLQQSMLHVQEAVTNIARVISGQPPLKLPILGERAKSWLLITYLDEDLRISRCDGGLVMLAKEGSPLLRQLA